MVLDPRKAWPKEVVVACILLLAYFSANYGSSDRREVAMAHFRELASLEKRLGIFVERDLQQLILGTPLVGFVNVFYALLHSVIILGFAVTLFVTGRNEYPYVRNLLLAFSLISFLIYFLYPLAPPRIMDEYGFVDTLDETPGVSYETGFLSGLMNAYAAMPSVHIGYTLIVGGFIYLKSRRLLFRLLGPAYPALMLFVVTSSANHLLIDCIVSVPLLIFTVLIIGKVDLPGRLARYLRR